jgi:LDH2 family malate/lactate/ureidoglycolate dehydrogenase
LACDPTDNDYQEGFMPLFKADALLDLGTRIFVAMGAPETVAGQVTRSLVLSSLVGMDSHGILRIPQYVNEIRKGTIVPAAEPVVVRDRGVAALMDGQWAFGQIVAAQAMRLAVDKARQHTIGIVSFSKVLHIGRLGEWVALAADQGFVGFALTNGAIPGGMVAPYGSRQRLLGTNPVAFGLPAGSRPPIVADFSTSVTAEGKVRLAMFKGARVPEGWLADRDGRPTTDPADLYNGGALQTVGGHKGYALSVVVEVLGGILSGANVPAAPGYTTQNGVFMLALDVTFFRDVLGYQADVGTLLDAIKAAPPTEGTREVLIPGEPELITRRQRERDGIPVDEQTWAEIQKLAAELNIAA